jgi:hypothetical protein
VNEGGGQCGGVDSIAGKGDPTSAVSAIAPWTAMVRAL